MSVLLFMFAFFIGVAIGIVIAVSVMKNSGRWIENEFGVYCSECGLYAYRSNGIPWKSNYCPNCGAKMEGEE